MEKAVYLQAKHLAAKGVEVTLVTRPPTEAGAGVFPARVLCVPYGGVPAGRHGRILDRSVNYPRFANAVGRAVATEVRAGRVDVVDAQGLTALGYLRLRRRDPGLRAPLVMNPQGMEEHRTRGVKRLALSRLRALSREAARLADRVVATDDATRADVPRLLGVDPGRVVVLPNGIDPEELRSLTPADPARVVHEALPDLDDAYPLFLSVGRLEGYKAFGDVLGALRGLARGERLPRRWAWVVVGEGPSVRSLEEQAGVATLEAALRLKGERPPRHVVLAGRATDALLHALYERGDIFVHATRGEGSSLVTLEAMAHGLPVVATRAGGIPDKVVEGVTGRLVPPGDVPALAAALAELASDAGRRRAFGEAGRAHALSRFAWPVLIERTIALYQELLREPRR
jgi:glycosyltransferase involved in cell wall biosynthesis